MRPVVSKDQSYKRHWGQHFGAIQGQFDQKSYNNVSYESSTKRWPHVQALHCRAWRANRCANRQIGKSLKLFTYLLHSGPAKAQKLTGS